MDLKPYCTEYQIWIIAVGANASAAYGIYVIYRLIGGLTGDLASLEHININFILKGAAMILTVISIGRYLEGASKGHTTDAISRLLELTPDEPVSCAEIHSSLFLRKNSKLAISCAL